VFEKNLVFLYRHGSRNIAWNCPDARATPSRCGLKMETCEARYGKTVAQFTVRTLYAFVRTLPRGILISGDLGLLSLLIEASRCVLFTEFGIEFSIA
jgi:hypothetical protein